MLHICSYCFVDYRKSLWYLPHLPPFSYFPCHEQKSSRDFNNSNIRHHPTASQTVCSNNVLNPSLSVSWNYYQQNPLKLHTHMLINGELPCSLTWIMQWHGQSKRRCQIMCSTNRPDTLWYFCGHWQPLCRGAGGCLLWEPKEQTRRCLAM